MTSEEKTTLFSTVSDSVTSEQIGYFFRVNIDHTAISAYVDSLLAARDAEIEQLKVRQISPEMEGMYTLYLHDEIMGDLANRETRFIGYAIPFFLRYCRMRNPELWNDETEEGDK